MKNGSISEQLELQNQDFTGEKKTETFQSSERENNISCNLDSKKNKGKSDNQKNKSNIDSLLSIFSLRDGNNYHATLADELQIQKRKKKKQRGISRTKR